MGCEAGEVTEVLGVAVDIVSVSGYFVGTCVCVCMCVCVLWFGIVSMSMMCRGEGGPFVFL